MYVWSLSYNYSQKEFTLEVIDRPLHRHMVMEALDLVCSVAGHRFCSGATDHNLWGSITEWVEAKDDTTETALDEANARTVLPEFVDRLTEEGEDFYTPGLE